MSFITKNINKIVYSKRFGIYSSIDNSESYNISDSFKTKQNLHSFIYRKKFTTKRIGYYRMIFFERDEFDNDQINKINTINNNIHKNINKCGRGK